MSNITKEQVIEIFENTDASAKGDNSLWGCNIIAKYTTPVIQGADRGMIISEDIDKLIDAGITVEDVRKLASINWSLDEEDEYLICYV